MIAEIERLRAEADLLRTGRDVTREHADRLEAETKRLRASLHATRRVRDTLRLRLTHLSAILLRADDLATEAERAAVATYLRGLADDYGVCIDLSLAEQADIIERGEHRREGDE